MHSPWRLDGRRATLRLGQLEARVDLERPESGLDQLSLSGQSIARRSILGVVLPMDRRGSDRFVDAYVRGNDLIASYTENTQPSFRWQIYWRACCERFPAVLAAIEAIVSVQTDLLEGEPELFLGGELPTLSATAWRTEANGKLTHGRIEAPVAVASQRNRWACFGFELPDKVGYVEMAHPDDFITSTLALGDKPTPGTTLCHRLFGDQLEKGVILRSRVLALFLPELPTTEGIAALKRLLMDEALPLTT